MNTTPADFRAAARCLIAVLPRPLPRSEARRADAVQAALLASSLLDSSELGNSPAVAAAVRDGLTSLAHLLDETVPGHGAGQLLLLLLAGREAFTPHPAPTEDQLRARDTASALLQLARWHTDHEDDDDQLCLLGAALQVHAEETAPPQQDTSADGVCLLVSEAVTRLKAEGWRVEIAKTGLRLADGKLTRLITYRDSLASLVDRGETNNAVDTLRRARAARRRPTP